MGESGDDRKICKLYNGRADIVQTHELEPKGAVSVTFSYITPYMDGQSKTKRP